MTVREKIEIVLFGSTIAFGLPAAMLVGQAIAG